MIYYIYIEEKQIGPLSVEEVGKYKIFSNTLVWREDQRNWKTANDFEELQKFFLKIPPSLVDLPPIRKDTLKPTHIPPPIAGIDSVSSNFDTMGEIVFEKGNSFTTWGIISIVIGIPLSILLMGSGIFLILYGIMQLTHPQYPLIFREGFLLYKTSSITSTRKIAYNEIVKIDYREKKMKIYYLNKWVYVQKNMFKVEDWNSIVDKFKTIKQ